MQKFGPNKFYVGIFFGQNKILARIKFSRKNVGRNLLFGQN